MNKIRPYMMPVAMLLGGVCYPFFSRLAFLTPWLIFTMLLLTYCNLSLRRVRPTAMHGWLISIQVLGSVAVYLLLRPLDEVLAQAVMVCLLAPTATSAPVITRLLGGSVESLTTYSLMCNAVVAVLAPLMFSWAGGGESVSFAESFFTIGRQVGVLLVVPFVLGVLVRRLVPKVATCARTFSNISFCLWSVALTIVSANIVNFILAQDAGHYRQEMVMAACSLCVCIAQFAVGRKIGRRYGDTIVGGQGLGQKNTILAIWMAQTYLNPLSSVGPGTYVLWQNMVNSYQVWRKSRKEVES